MDCSPPQASLSMRFSRQEYWSWLPCPPPEGLPNLGTELGSPALQEDSLPSEPPGKPKWVAYPFSGDLPDPGIKLGSSTLQADSLPAELPGKPLGGRELSKDLQNK